MPESASERDIYALMSYRCARKQGAVERTACSKSCGKAAVRKSDKGITQRHGNPKGRVHNEQKQSCTAAKNGWRKPLLVHSAEKQCQQQQGRKQRARADVNTIASTGRRREDSGRPTPGQPGCRYDLSVCRDTLHSACSILLTERSGSAPASLPSLRPGRCQSHILFRCLM